MLQRRSMRRTRFHTVRWIAVLFLAILLGLATEFLFFTVEASKRDGPAAVAFFAVLTLPFLALAGLLLGLSRPVTLTRSDLRIPTGFRTVVVSLNDVAGVGLLYHYFRPATRSSGAWSLFVWRRNGSLQRVTGPICRSGPDAPPSQIAATRVGKLARRLDGMIQAIQGPTGSLATLELQKHASVGLTDSQLAFWSPDGDMGPTHY